jgi:hypothetical protein
MVFDDDVTKGIFKKDKMITNVGKTKLPYFVK